MSYTQPHFIDKSTKQPVFYSDIKTWSIHRYDNLSAMTLLIILVFGVFTGGIAFLWLFGLKENISIHLVLNNDKEMNFNINEKILKELITSDCWHSSSAMLTQEIELTQEIT